MGSRFFSLSSILSTSALVATMLLSSPAFAKARPWRPDSVPEIAAAGLVGAGTLLVGGLAIARSRRRKS
jgi:hypothetical protein